MLKPYNNPSPAHEKYPAFCQQMLLAFRPWREPRDVLQGLQVPPVDFVPSTGSTPAHSPEDHQWVSAFEWWVHSRQAPLCIQREHQPELEKAILDLEVSADGGAAEALVGAFLNGKVCRNGFKRKVRVFRARFLNNGQVPLVLASWRDFFVHVKTAVFFATRFTPWNG